MTADPKLEQQLVEAQIATIRKDYLQPAIENAINTLDPHPAVVLHAVVVTAYSLCVALTGHDEAQAKALFSDTTTSLLQHVGGAGFTV
jgi:hypothetical protein